MLIGTDFLWKAVTVGRLRELLAEFSDDDWVYADRNSDLAVIKGENLHDEKNRAYPGNAVLDLMTETVRRDP
jgi:hypothetical protein